MSDAHERPDLNDQALDRGLRTLADRLPEPVAPDAVRCHIEQTADEVIETRHVIGRLRAGVAALSTVAALLAIGATVLVLDNTRLRSERNELALRDTERDAAPVPTREATYAVVAFHHDGCKSACSMTPRFREMAERHVGDANVMFICFDLTEANRARAIALANSLELPFLFDQTQGLARSGSFAMINLETKEILERVNGTEQLVSFEKSLEVRCQGCPGSHAPAP